MATKVQESQIEVVADLAVLTPKLQGLYALAELKVSPDSNDMSPRAHEDVLDSIKNYERRIQLEQAQRDADLALLEDGYPNMPLMAIDPTALASIRSNAASVVLAAATFISDELPEGQAAALNPSAGVVELKPTA